MKIFFRKNATLIFILLVSAFFRLYKFHQFQYFSGDEEIFYFLVRKIVEVKPVLVVPNAQLSTSIGSFFHLLSAPLFYLTMGSPVIMSLFASILGVFTTYFVYVAGKIILDKRLGYIASFLYATSALVSLFDRRWWALTLDPLLAVIHIIGAVKLVEKKIIYLFLLLFPATFAWHSDPSLTVLLLSSLLVFIVFRLPLIKREYLFTFLFVLISILPILVFEIRHPGTVFRPFFVHIFSRNTEESLIGNNFRSTLSVDTIFQNFTRFFFLTPSENISLYFHYRNSYPKPLGYHFTEVILLIFLSLPIWYLVVKRSVLKPVEIKKFISPYFVLFSFLFGISFYSYLLKYSVHQHYYVVTFPAVVLIISEGLFFISKLGLQKFIYIFFCFLLLANINTLVNSTVTYPTRDKIVFLEKLADNVSLRDSSVYVFGNRDITDGGWIYLLGSMGLKVQRSYLNWGWDWIYRSHGLFPYDPDQPDGKHIVIIHETGNPVVQNSFGERFLNSLSQGKISATILDNSQRWYSDQLLENIQKEYNKFN